MLDDDLKKPIIKSLAIHVAEFLATREIEHADIELKIKDGRLLSLRIVEKLDLS